jgi:hypothetical protein
MEILMRSANCRPPVKKKQKKVQGTANVIEDIGYAAMQVASLVDEYTKYRNLAGRQIPLLAFISDVTSQ